jgi:drug/metabolite transporter (DMT)-like permease
MIVSKSDPKPADEEKLTFVGCVLTVLSLAVILVSALPIVRWRDHAGRPLPRMVAVFAPVVLGATFHAVGTAILWLFGLKVLKKPEKDKLDWPEL